MNHIIVDFQNTRKESKETKANVPVDAGGSQNCVQEVNFGT